MPLSLSILLPFHWMVAFCLFAAVCSGGADGFSTFIGFVDASSSGHFAGNASLSLFFGVIFTLVAALFLWCFVTAFTAGGDFPGDYENVAAKAFGIAVAAITALLLTSFSRNAHMVVATAALTAALAASYAAVINERRAMALGAAAAVDEIQAVVKRVALGAAHASLLSKLAGRGPHRDGEGAT